MVSQKAASNTLISHWKPTKPSPLSKSEASDPIPSKVVEKLRLYRTAHNEVESRVYSLEKVARPYREFEKKTRQGIALMQDVRADILGKRQRALDDIDDRVEAAGAEYAGYVKRVAKGGVELSTNALARALVRRLEDGDVVRSEIGGKLAELLVGDSGNAGVEVSTEGRGESRALPTPPDDEPVVTEKMNARGKTSPKRQRLDQTTATAPKRPSTRSQRVSDVSQDVPAELAPTPDESTERTSGSSPAPRSTRSQRNHDLERSDQSIEHIPDHSATSDIEESSAPRRTSRRHVPAKRQQDFVTWGEVRASQEAKRRRRS